MFGGLRDEIEITLVAETLDPVPSVHLRRGIRLILSWSRRWKALLGEVIAIGDCQMARNCEEGMRAGLI